MEPTSIPKVWKNHEIDTHGLIDLAKLVKSTFEIRADKAAEK